MVALVLVFFVVIFFWMSFHQNGLTQTFFARDYTVKEVGPIFNIFFNLNSMLAFIGCLAGLFLLIHRKKIAHKTHRPGHVHRAAGALTYYFVSGYQASEPHRAGDLPVVQPAVHRGPHLPGDGHLRLAAQPQQEPSTPRKIGIGMVIAAVGFVIMLVASLHLAAPKLVASASMTEWGRVSPLG